MAKSILLACKISKTVEQSLLEKGYQLCPFDQGHDAATILGILTSTKLKLDESTLAKYSKLQWIGRLGSGMEIIDLNYCEEHGIRVVSSPKGISNAVAEHVNALIIAWHKNIIRSSHEIRNRKWIREANRGQELISKTLGIIGYGHTGNAVAKKLAPLCKDVLAFDKYKTGFGSIIVRECTLEAIQQEADIISFHVPLTAETSHYYDATFIKKARPHVIINTSRGAVVHTEDLMNGIRTKQVLGACLDVIEDEQTLADSEAPLWETIHQLQDLGVIITPHIAGYSHDAVDKMSQELYTQLLDLL